VTHDATARANQLQWRDLDRLNIDAYHDEPAADREPVDRRRHRLGASNGREHGSRAAKAVECRCHVFSRVVDEVVRTELAGERLFVATAYDRDGADAELVLSHSMSEVRI
jgi:hypothetical protein